MPISEKDKLNLIKDILNNHQIDHCGSISECEQLGRLVNSLINQSHLEETSISTLNEIYNYSQNGVNSPQLDEHIEAHQQVLSQWITRIDQFF